MGTATVLERPAIEDTLFGEPRVVDVQADAGPDACFCVCRCTTGATKMQSSTNVSADMALGIMPD